VATASQLADVVRNEAATSARKAGEFSMDGSIAGGAKANALAQQPTASGTATTRGIRGTAAPVAVTSPAHHDEVEVQLPDPVWCPYPEVAEQVRLVGGDGVRDAGERPEGDLGEWWAASSVIVRWKVSSQPPLPGTRTTGGPTPATA
jgi:hypothetical protein